MVVVQRFAAREDTARLTLFTLTVTDFRARASDAMVIEVLLAVKGATIKAINSGTGFLETAIFIHDKNNDLPVKIATRQNTTHFHHTPIFRPRGELAEQLWCHDFPALLVVGVVVHQQRNKITRRTVVFVVER